jgi:membrane-associated phospholipid phosphatase
MSGHAFTAGPLPGGVRVARAGAGRALGVACLCLAALGATWAASALSPGARLHDALALHDFTLLSRPHVNGAAHALLGLLEPSPFTASAIALIALAMLRRRPDLALAIGAVMSLAPLTTELLKPLLAHAHDQVAGAFIADASWPSGHATAATALACCATIATPPRLRRVVASAGLLFVAAVGCSLLILAWHMPSDVVGGYLVGALWTALAVAALRAHDSRQAARRSDAPPAPGQLSARS